MDDDGFSLSILSRGHKNNSKKYKMSLVLSNILYFVGAVVAMKYGKYWYGGLLLLLTAVSIGYHVDSRLLTADKIVSLAVLSTSLWYLVTTSGQVWPKLTGLTALVLMAGCLYLGKRYSYSTWHPCAHIFGGVGVIIGARYGSSTWRLRR